MTALVGEVFRVSDVTLEAAGVSWAADQWLGYWLVPNWNVNRVFRIVGNNATALFVARYENGEGLETVTAPRAYFAIITEKEAERYLALVKRTPELVPEATKVLYYFEGNLVGAPVAFSPGAYPNPATPGVARLKDLRLEDHVFAADTLAEAAFALLPTATPTVPYLWLVPTNGGLFRVATALGARAAVDVGGDGSVIFKEGLAVVVEEALRPTLIGRSGMGDANARDLAAYAPSAKALLPATLRGFSTALTTRPTYVAGKGVYAVAYTGTPGRRRFSLTDPDATLVVATGALLEGTQATLHDEVQGLWFVGDSANGGSIRKVDLDTLSTTASLTGITTQQAFCFRQPTANPSVRELISVSSGGNTIKRIDPVGFTVTATATISGMATPGDLAYDPTRDEIWVTSLSTKEVYRLRGSDFTTLSVCSTLKIPYQLFYEPYATGGFGTTGDRVWVLQGFSGDTPHYISAINPAAPTVREEDVSLGTTVFADNQNLKTAYTPAIVGVKDLPTGDNDAPLLSPETWTLPGMRSAIVCAHFRGGSHNTIDAGTGRVDRMIDLSGHGRHMVPYNGVAGKRCLHIDSEPTARNNPCFRFARTEHMVSEGWTMASALGVASPVGSFPTALSYPEFCWFIVYRPRSTPIGTEALFGSFSPVTNLCIASQSGGATQQNTLVLTNGSSAASAATFSGSRSDRVFAFYAGQRGGTNGVFQDCDRGGGGGAVYGDGIDASYGLEMGNTLNGAFTALDADIYEVFLVKRVNSASYGGDDSWAGRFFDRYTRQKYGT